MAIILSNYYSLFIRLPEKPERETYFDKEQRIFTESRDNCGQAYLVPIPQAAKTDICAEYLEMRGITAKNKDDFEDEVAYMEYMWSIAEQAGELDEEIDLGDLYRDYVNIRGIAYQLPESFPDGKDYLVLPGKICYHSPENLAKASDVISCVERWAQKRFGNQNDNDLHRYIVFRLLSIIRKWALENNIKDIKLVQPYLPENKLKFINIMALINIKSHKNDQTK